jgi:hypothetical protein
MDGVGLYSAVASHIEGARTRLKWLVERGGWSRTSQADPFRRQGKRLVRGGEKTAHEVIIDHRLTASSVSGRRS